MSKLIHAVLVAAAILATTSVMAAPRYSGQHSPRYYGYTPNSSERDWQWWDNEADHR